MKKLTIELVPKTCHYSNVRTMVKPSEWDKIRHIVYEKANNKCEICQDIGTNQGYKHRVECHEVWEYDESDNTQRLAGLVALCPTCHQVKHIGRARMIGKLYACYKQLYKVNRWSKEQIEKHIAESNLEYKRRSKIEWKLDISLLKKEPYNIEIDVDKDRVFETYKKPKKRKQTPQLKLGLNVPEGTKKTKTKGTKKAPKKVIKDDENQLKLIFKESLKKNKKIEKKIHRKPPKK